MCPTTYVISLMDLNQMYLLKWQMTNQNVQHVFFVLDLRSTSSHEDLITTNEGQALANKLRLSFCETSALTKAGLKECFEVAVSMTLPSTTNSCLVFCFCFSILIVFSSFCFCFCFISVFPKLNLFTPGQMHCGQSKGA